MSIVLKTVVSVAVLAVALFYMRAPSCPAMKTSLDTLCIPGDSKTLHYCWVKDWWTTLHCNDNMPVFTIVQEQAREGDQGSGRRIAVGLPFNLGII